MQLSPPHLLYPYAEFKNSLPRGGPIHADFTKWDILGLRSNTRLKRVSQESIQQHGLSLSHTRAQLPYERDPFRKLEEEVARYFGCEDSLLFTSRTQALFSLFSNILTEQDALFAAAHATGPLAEACALTGASLSPIDVYAPETYAHAGGTRDILFVETIHPITYQAIDPLLCSQHPAQNRALILDESLALGALGALGLGITETLRTTLQFCFFAVIVDCSLILGQQGCFVVSSKESIARLRAASRTYRFEMPLARSLVETISEAFSLLQFSQQARFELSHRATQLRAELEQLKLRVTQCGPYLAIICRRFSEAQTLSTGLAERGVLTSYGLTLRPHSDESVVKIMIGINHSQQDFELLLEGISEMQKRASH